MHTADVIGVKLSSGAANLEICRKN